MSHDGAVPRDLPEYLDPHHVDVSERGATPLTAFEKNDVDRFTGKSHLLKSLADLYLSRSELERNILASLFVLDTGIGKGEKIEVVLTTQTAEATHDRLTSSREIVSGHVGGYIRTDRATFDEHSNEA